MISETIKILEENIGKILSNINHRRILYDPPLRVMKIKTKNQKVGEITKQTILKKKKKKCRWLINT